MANPARNLRAQEPYLMYDSIAIGPGAGAGDGNLQVTGWFNSWADFAKTANKDFEWFGTKRTNVPEWASNTSGEREDFSLYFYQLGFEILVPTGLSGVDQNGADLLTPLLVPELLARYMRIGLKIANVDTVLTVPASHVPAGSGPAGGGIDGVSGPAIFAPNNGVPAVQNAWQFAAPQPIARQGKWEVLGKLGQPAVDFFKDLPGPGVKILTVPGAPGAPPTRAIMPNFTILRMWMRGYRNVQLRGARER